LIIDAVQSIMFTGDKPVIGKFFGNDLPLKGILHPKIENSVIIYSPSSWVSFFCWTQRKIFWRM